MLRNNEIIRRVFKDKFKKILNIRSDYEYEYKRRKEGYKKTEILYVNEGKKIYKMLCCVAVNCINRSKKGIRLFKYLHF